MAKTKKFSTNRLMRHVHTAPAQLIGGKLDGHNMMHVVLQRADSSKKYGFIMDTRNAGLLAIGLIHALSFQGVPAFQAAFEAMKEWNESEGEGEEWKSEGEGSPE